ncbi:glycosyl hydrolase family 28-related protein, partial [Pseudochrobactrum sp. sp1633]|uniref:glycosyl hydrolase family 28-related protein n=1 Tax=Pseudochrobactrum sp. sp1633 TaxID=3036706 RepID=UPI0025A5F009
GYYATGDGGDALYKRVISEPAHAGKVQSADGAWWELSEEEPSVKMFGAKADGANDDTASLQAAIDYCSAKFSGGMVRLANGVHLISSSLIWKDHVSMRGEGQTSSTIKATGSMVRMISMINLWLSGVSLERFRVDGVQGQTVGLYVEQTVVGTGETVGHLQMSDVQFVNHLNGLDGAGVFALFDSSLTKVDFIQCTGAGAFIQGSGMNFYGCTFRVCGDGVRIAYLAGGSIGGPRFFGGVWVQNNFDVTFDGSLIRPCQFYGCWMEMCKTGVFATYNSGGAVNFLGVKVDGCLFQPDSTSPGAAIWNVASFNGSVTFSDCVVVNSPSVNADLPNRYYNPGAGGVLSVSSSVRTNGADSWQVLPDFTTNTLVNMRGVFSDRKYPDDASAGAAGLLQGDIYYNTSTAFLTMKN